MVGVLDEAEPRSALAHPIGLTFGVDSLLGGAFEGPVEVVDADRDVPVSGAQLVAAPVVVERQLQLLLARELSALTVSC